MMIWIFMLPVRKWKFQDFEIIDELKSYSINGLPYYLYGFTDDREVMKAFKNDRDMSKFLVKKYDVTVDQLETMFPSMPEITFVRCSFKNGFNSIAMTSFEESVTSFAFPEIIFDQMESLEPAYADPVEDLKFLKHEYQVALIKLGIRNLFDLFSDITCGVSEDYDVPGFSGLEKNWSTLNIFIYIFGELFDE